MSAVPSQVIIGVTVDSLLSILQLALYTWLQYYIQITYYTHTAVDLADAAQPVEPLSPTESLDGHPFIAAHVPLSDEPSEQKQQQAVVTIDTDCSTAASSTGNDAFNTGVSWSRFFTCAFLLAPFAISVGLLYACLFDEWTYFSIFTPNQEVRCNEPVWLYTKLFSFDNHSYSYGCNFFGDRGPYISYSHMISRQLSESDAPWDDPLTYVYIVLLFNGIATLMQMIVTLLAGFGGVLYSLAYMWQTERNDSTAWQHKPLWMVRAFVWLPFGSSLTVLSTTLLQHLVIQAFCNNFEGYDLVTSWDIVMVCAVGSLLMTAALLRRVGVQYDAAYFQAAFPMPSLDIPVTAAANNAWERVSLLTRPTITQSELDATLNRLHQLGSMRRGNLLTEDEFLKLKQRIIEPQAVAAISEPATVH